MAIVMQLTRVLSRRPVVPAVDGVRLRNYQGPADAETWLDLRRRAFARQQVGVGDWDEADFRREFLDKTWWRPEAMWFAEADAHAGTSTVGMITLAERGDGLGARPVVHWLAVLGSHRRRGIGHLLVATVEAAAWDAGFRQVWLETHSAWKEAARLYEALGYLPTS